VSERKTTSSNAAATATTSPGKTGQGFTQSNLSASAPKIDGINVVYDDVEKIEMLKVSGNNLSPYKEKVRIIVNGSQANVLRAEPSYFTAVLPQDAANPALITIVMNGQTILQDKKVRLPPRVTGVSMLSGPPGTPLTIYGMRFARKLADNKVFIGGMQTPVNGGSTSTLMVVIPIEFNAMSPSWGMPVTVKVGNVSSNSDVTIRIQSRVY
jgi:hypothetical protein